MAKYLKKFRDLISKRQTSQILNLLNGKKNRGQIKSIEDFNQQLNTLVQELLNNTLQPSLKLFPAEEGGSIDSESYNYQLDRVGDDLVAAFEEANNIDTVHANHETLVRDVLFRRIRANMAALEQKLETYSFFEELGNEYSKALFSTFKKGDVNRQGRGSKGEADILFSDPRTGEVLDTEFDAFIDGAMERIVLAKDRFTYHTITEAKQIFDSEAVQSELLVEPAYSSLQNMTDGTTGTYWLQSLLFKNKKSEVKTKVEFSLGGPREINFLEVEPASRYGVVLETIEYLSANHEVLTVASPDLFISTKRKVAFPRVFARKVILTFRSAGRRRVEFEYNEDVVPLFEQASGEPLEGYTPSLEKAAGDLLSIIPNSKVRDILGVSDPSVNNSVFVGYEYIFGIDNIYIGVAEYEDVGIYSSKGLKVEKLARIALRAAEVRPRTTGTSIVNTSITSNDTTDDIFYHGSIEYYAFKQDFNENDALLRATVFPVLPRFVTRINHERLVLDEYSSSTASIKDIGNTRFFTNRTDGDVKVFKNGVEITDATGGAGSGWVDISSADDRTPNTGDPMTIKIQVSGPTAGDIYTVSYNVLTSTTATIPETLSEFTTRTGALVADMAGDLSVIMNHDNSVILNNDLLGVDVAYSKIHTIIVLRANTSDKTVTPAVEDFILAAGGLEKERFEVL